METRIRRFASTLLVATLTATTVSAGGWVVITVQDLPDHIVAGTPVMLTYAVRQHGSTLTGGLTGRIEARRADGQVVEARATASSDQGYYVATLTVPASGTWTVVIDSGFGGNFDSVRLVLPAIASDAVPPTVSDADRGERLFAAKGCATCHRHPAIESPSVAAAPDLSVRRYQAEFLKQFLAHPPSGKPGQWEMPDLKLREAEIASLVAFIAAPRPGDGSLATGDSSVARCEVTRPDGQGAFREEPAQGPPGNEALSTSTWHDGVVTFKPGGPGFVTRDGSLGMKWAGDEVCEVRSESKAVGWTYPRRHCDLRLPVAATAISVFNRLT